jgi:hypothetical protein
MGLEGIVSDPWRPRLDGRRKAQLKGLARHAGYCSSDVRAEASTSTDAYLNVGRFVEWLEIGKIEIPLSGRRLPKRRGRKEASPFARV